MLIRRPRTVVLFKVLDKVLSKDKEKRKWILKVSEHYQELVIKKCAIERQGGVKNESRISSLGNK